MGGAAEVGWQRVRRYPGLVESSARPLQQIRINTLKLFVELAIGHSALILSHGLPHFHYGSAFPLLVKFIDGVDGGLHL